MAGGYQGGMGHGLVYYKVVKWREVYTSDAYTFSRNARRCVPFCDHYCLVLLRKLGAALIGERERANLVVQLGRFFYIQVN